jgi:hypothetical protein
MMKPKRARLIFGSITALWLTATAPLVCAAGGDLLWEDRFDLTGGFDSAEAVAVQEHRLFVFGQGQVPSVNGIEDFDWIIRAYDRLSGTLLWQDQVDGGLDIAENARAIAVHGRHVLAVGAAGGNGDGDYWVRAYDANTGRLRWEDRIVNPAGSETAADVVIQGQKAFVVGTRVKVYDVKRGTVIWEDPEGSGEAIAISGNTMFTAGSRNGDFSVRAYHSKTGVLLWEDLSDLSGGQDTATDLEVHKDRVIAVGSAGDFPNRDFVVRAYEPKTGALRWEDRLDLGTVDEATAVDIKNRYAYVVGRVRPSGSSDFIVRAYDRKTGALRWEDTVDFFGGNDIARTVTVAGGQVFVGGSLQEAGFSNPGIVVRAYDAKSGGLNWMDQLVAPQASGIKGIASLGGQVHAVGSLSLDFLVRTYAANSGRGCVKTKGDFRKWDTGKTVKKKHHKNHHERHHGYNHDDDCDDDEKHHGKHKEKGHHKRHYSKHHDDDRNDDHQKR